MRSTLLRLVYFYFSSNFCFLIIPFNFPYSFSSSVIRRSAKHVSRITCVSIAKEEKTRERSRSCHYLIGQVLERALSLLERASIVDDALDSRPYQFVTNCRIPAVKQDPKSSLENMDLTLGMDQLGDSVQSFYSR